jgi:hypothetical protein
MNEPLVKFPPVLNPRPPGALVFAASTSGTFISIEK